MKTILVLGSGALKVGEAGEFDYSGSQAIKAIAQCNDRSIVLNPNVASTQSNLDFANIVISKPITSTVVEDIFVHYNVDAILIGFGGQTALNCALDCHRKGLFKKYNVKILGTKIESIITSESRQHFATLVKELGFETSQYLIVNKLSQVYDHLDSIQYPVFVRSSESLGGLASCICVDQMTLIDHCEKSFNFCSTLIIEEYLEGYKEIEYEILRDYKDNCISVCNMENIDPMGVHTGDSIVVAPSQTINDEIHQNLRNTAFEIARSLEIIGECNVQFAVHPTNHSFRVIELNARLSRSSALASKAASYPIALIATKLCLGYGLWQLKNKILGTSSAVMEPALDYICVKIPKWEDIRFFQKAISIGPEMQSVGEVMAIGRSFEEAIQKAIRMVHDGHETTSTELTPNSQRILHILNSFRKGISLDNVLKSTKIDSWFLGGLNNLVNLENNLKIDNLLNINNLKRAKQSGFSDLQIARLFNISENEVRLYRKKLNIIPWVKTMNHIECLLDSIGSCLYHSYLACENDVLPVSNNKSILLIGSGAFQIGSSLEFDWCCIQTLKSIKKLGYKSIFINHNPETLSTDFDQSDRLYFEELSLEKILDIIDFEKPIGVIVSMSGQLGNNLSKSLNESGINVLGTRQSSIEICENRALFSGLLKQLHIKEATCVKDLNNQIKYPVIVRPSAILSGIGMKICSNKTELNEVLNNFNTDVFINEVIFDAKEIEFDGVSDGNSIITFAICEQIERAGVHSGDSSLICPTIHVSQEIQKEILRIVQVLIKSLEIIGVFNLQFILKNKQLYLIECNLRASRTIPFVSKVRQINFIEINTQVYLGHFQNIKQVYKSNLFGVKVAQFSNQRLKDIDPNLGVIMRSTGEVACYSNNYYQALLDAMIAVGYPDVVKKILIIADSIDCVKKLNLKILQIQLICIDQTKDIMNDLDLQYAFENVSTLQYDFDLFICLTKNAQIEIQRQVLERGISVLNNSDLAIEYFTALTVLE